jgi:hypothetical protein
MDQLMRLEKHPLLQRSAYNKPENLLNIRINEPSTSGSLASQDSQPGVSFRRKNLTV